MVTEKKASQQKTSSSFTSLMISRKKIAECWRWKILQCLEVERYWYTTVGGSHTRSEIILFTSAENFRIVKEKAFVSWSRFRISNHFSFFPLKATLNLFWILHSLQLSLTHWKYFNINLKLYIQSSVDLRRQNLFKLNFNRILNIREFP